MGVGWFWYLGTLVPVIGVVQVGVQAMADRYTYIPTLINQSFNNALFPLYALPQRECSSRITNNDMSDPVFPGKLQNGFHRIITFIVKNCRAKLTG